MITNNMYFYPRLCIFMRILSFIVRSFRNSIPKLVTLYGRQNQLAEMLHNVNMALFLLYRLFVVFLVRFREHFEHLIHIWKCANIKVFRGGHRSWSPEGVIGGGHRRGSPEGVTGGSHRRQSLRASIESCLLHSFINVFK